MSTQELLTYAIEVVFFLPFVLALVNTKFSHHKSTPIISTQENDSMNTEDISKSSNPEYADEDVAAICETHQPMLDYTIITAPKAKDIVVHPDMTMEQLYTAIKTVSIDKGIPYPSRYCRKVRTKTAMFEYLDSLLK